MNSRLELDLTAIAATVPGPRTPHDETVRPSLDEV